MPRPYGVSVFGDNMYWVDQGLKKIFKDSKLPGNQSSDPEVIRANLNGLVDVMVFDQSQQPAGTFIFLLIFLRNMSQVQTAGTVVVPRSCVHM